MTIFFQQVSLGQVQLKWVFLQDFCDATIVGLQLQLELVQLQVKLSQ